MSVRRIREASTDLSKQRSVARVRRHPAAPNECYEAAKRGANICCASGGNVFDCAKQGDLYYLHCGEPPAKRNGPPRRDDTDELPPLRRITMPIVSGKGCFDACDTAKRLGYQFCSVYAVEGTVYNLCNSIVDGGLDTCLSCCAQQPVKPSVVGPCVGKYLQDIESTVFNPGKWRLP